MPKIFAITPVRDRVTLDATGQARVTFNVANTGGEAVRGRVIPVPLQSTKAEWLSVEGENERVFSAEQTQQFTIRVSVPPGIGPGDFSLRLDCVATNNPDELFTEGPVVAFTVAKPEAPKPFPWWIVAVAAAAMVVIASVVYWFAFRDTSVEVPNLAGLKTEQAQERLEAVGLKMAGMRTEQFTESPDMLPEGVSFPPEAGVILGSTPIPGERVPPGTEISLIVEAESVKVPRVVDLTTDRAVDTLRRGGLELGDLVFQRSDEAHKSVVINQDPPKDTRRPVGSGVKIVVGSGRGRFVPGKLTYSVVEASAILSAQDIAAVNKIKKGKDFNKIWSKSGLDREPHN